MPSAIIAARGAARAGLAVCAAAAARGAACAFALAIAVALAPAAQAQLFVDTVTRELAGKNAAQLDALKEQVLKLNAAREHMLGVIDELRAQNAALTQKNQDLEQQARQMVGRLEEVQRLAEQAASDDGARALAVKMQAQITTLQTQLDDLRQEFQDIAVHVDVPTEDDQYSAAYADFLASNYEAAIAGFNRVLQNHPDGQFAANCRYYLGQAHLALNQYDLARENAQTLLDDHPDSDKTAPALLIVAKAYQGLELQEQYLSQLRYLINEHPTSLAADEARQRLSQ